jgi:adhesin/invasin
LGEFRTGIATTQALTRVLTVLLTPIAKPKEGAAVTGQAVPITFTPKEIPIPDTLTLNVLGNNAATGEPLDLVILARKGGSPLGNVPVSLLVEPSDTPPDITGSVIFSEGFEGLTDGKSGVFRAKITNNRPGSIKVTARAKPAGPNSNTVEITFVSGATDTVKEVSELKLISSSPQLNSQQGNSEGVAITAIVRNKDNNLVAGAVVSFSSCVVNDADQCVDGDAGELQLTAVTDGATQTPGVTDDSGRAQAKLTTQGNADNRRIKVTASTPTTTGEIKQDSIIITVVGTTIAVTGPTSVIINTTAVFTVTLFDSNNQGVEGERITMTSALGNSFDNSSPVTNALGQAKVTLTANKAGKDTITASKVGAGKVSWK